ncbi:aminodeoxychorismate/anthranilate synthase component II [Bacillota bacterium LX-D]|nr:aminodeoxychorismate/anthranilate synthase component II [Bacillota bacterium LX-D]
MILLIDNYDSFTYNLYQYLGEFTPKIEVRRNDQITIAEILEADFSQIVLSPGPGRPENAGNCVELIKAVQGQIPILGICLGHQAIGYAYGAEIVKAPKIMHGKASVITHKGTDIFAKVKNPLSVARYHSLVINEASLNEQLEITAATEDGIIMGIKHREFPVYGLQFHPESILTEAGKQLINNFLAI